MFNVLALVGVDTKMKLLSRRVNEIIGFPLLPTLPTNPRFLNFSFAHSGQMWANVGKIKGDVRPNEFEE